MNVVKYKYTGGAFLPNIPARDLSQADLDNLTEEQVAIVKGSSLYREVKASRTKGASNGKRD